MSDLLRIARAACAREGKKREERKESPTASAEANTFACFPPFPSGLEQWNQSEAIRLMHEADKMVEQSGVDGRDLDIQAAAVMVANASLTRDMETLRFALAEFAIAVRGVASRMRTSESCRARA